MRKSCVSTLVLLLSIACGGGGDAPTGPSDPPPAEPTASSIEVHAGDGQTARYGTEVATDPAVRVLDQRGNPMAGIEVEFQVTEGGGSISGPAQTTNASGVASVDAWNLGPEAGTNRLTATTPALPGQQVEISATARNPYWTVMVYLAGDNSLSLNGIQDIDEMEAAGAHPEVQVAVQAEFSTDQLGLLGCGSECFNRPNFDTFRYLLDGDASSVIGPDGQTTGIGNRDMTDPSELTAFIEWAREERPAENYALVLWNHGGGYKGLIEDVTSAGSNLMTLQEARAGIANAGGVDIVDFDMCLMAGYETLAVMEGVTEYAVFSEALVPGAGNPYQKILRELHRDAGSAPEQVSALFVEEFHEHYSGSRATTTKSAYDLSAYASFESELDGLATVLRDNLSTLGPAISEAATRSQRFEETQLKDLVNFVDSLRVRTDLPALTEALDNVRQAATGGFRVATRARTGSGASIGGGALDVSRSTGLHVLLPSGNTFDRLPNRGPGSFAAYRNQLPDEEWTAFLSDWLSSQSELLYSDQGSNRFEGYLVWEEGAVDADADVDFWILEPSGNLYIPWLGSVTPNGHLTNDSYYDAAYYEGILTNRYVRNGEYRIYAHLWRDPEDFRPYYDLTYRHGQSSSWQYLYEPDYPQLSLDNPVEDDPTPTWSEVDSGAYSNLHFAAVLTYGSSASTARLRVVDQDELNGLSASISSNLEGPTREQLETVLENLEQRTRTRQEFSGSTPAPEVPPITPGSMRRER